MNEPKSAPDLLSRAASIMVERGKQYDQPGGERSMAKCVAAFNAVTGRNLTEEEGWTFMAQLKLVRFFQNPAIPHRDSLEDLIAYAALFAESALTKGVDPSSGYVHPTTSPVVAKFSAGGFVAKAPKIDVDKNWGQACQSAK